jgi:hypothetical protein
MGEAVGGWGSGSLLAKGATSWKQRKATGSGRKLSEVIGSGRKLSEAIGSGRKLSELIRSYRNCWKQPEFDCGWQYCNRLLCSAVQADILPHLRALCLTVDIFPTPVFYLLFKFTSIKCYGPGRLLTHYPTGPL